MNPWFARWPGEAVFILASGPSLTVQQVEKVHEWRNGAEARKVIVINTTFRLAPWADVLYGCDAPWWRLYHDEVSKAFHGEQWTQDRLAHSSLGVNWIESQPLPGLGRRAGIIHQGQNGGFQAINLAYQAGAIRVYLLGFDMQGGHWHGDHPAPLTNPRPYLFDAYKRHFLTLARDLRSTACQVVNCTPDSALTCFPVMSLELALAADRRLRAPAIWT